VALNEADFELYPDEILAIIGDNGAGKSTLIKALSGRSSPTRARSAGRRARALPLAARRPPSRIETVYQDLAVAPALDIAANIFLGRERAGGARSERCCAMLDKRAMRREAARHLSRAQDRHPSITQAVENLSGGQRQGVAVVRGAAWARRVVIMDEPTAALGVKETGQWST
jgi:fructose transport system ATP-binding protein